MQPLRPKKLTSIQTSIGHNTAFSDKKCIMLSKQRNACDTKKNKQKTTANNIQLQKVITDDNN